MEHLEGNKWCTCEKCIVEKAKCSYSPDGRHDFVGGMFTDKFCKYCFERLDVSFGPELFEKKLCSFHVGGWEQFHFNKIQQTTLNKKWSE